MLKFSQRLKKEDRDVEGSLGSEDSSSDTWEELFIDS
jgi:hypothetical protein